MVEDNILGHRVRRRRWHLDPVLVEVARVLLVKDFILVGNPRCHVSYITDDDLLAVGDKLAGGLLQAWIRLWLLCLPHLGGLDGEVRWRGSAALSHSMHIIRVK